MFYGIIGTITDEPGSASNANRVLTNSQEESARMANLNILTHGNLPVDTGVLGFTELVTELEAIALLPVEEKPAKLQELGKRKGLSVARLCHIAAIVRLYGGVA